MAGTSWPNLVAGHKAKASEVEQKFDWLEGSLAPMTSGNMTNGVHSLGTSTAAWRYLYLGSETTTADCGIYFQGTNYKFYHNGSDAALWIKRIDKSFPDYRFEVDFSNPTLYIGGTMGAGGITLGNGVVQMYQLTDGSLELYSGGHWINFQSTSVFPSNGLTTGVSNLGTASKYWGEINYKTLTDRGCLAWFDEGVECANGTVASDLKALCKIQKHPTKKTVYGKPMLDYKSFPKISYKKAAHKGKEYPRSAEDEPYTVNKEGQTCTASDGIEMTSMFSIMIGALREISNRLDALEVKAK